MPAGARRSAGRIGGIDVSTRSRHARRWRSTPTAEWATPGSPSESCRLQHTHGDAFDEARDRGHAAQPAHDDRASLDRLHVSARNVRARRTFLLTRFAVGRGATATASWMPSCTARVHTRPPIVTRGSIGVRSARDRYCASAPMRSEFVALRCDMTPRSRHYSTPPAPPRTPLTATRDNPMPIDALGERIAELAARIHAATYELLVMLRRVRRRGEAGTTGSCPARTG